MSLPANLNVTIDFSGGPVFGIAFTIGDPKNGILGVNVLADKASDIVDISASTLKVDIKRGRNIIQDRFEAGTATIRVIDYNGDWNPENTSSPYYGKLIPLRKVRVSADYAGSSYFLFSGYSQNYKYTFPTNESFGYVDIECTDAFRLFNMAGVNTVTGATAGQDTGTRINKILDQVSFPSSMRTIATGSNTCVADPATTRTSLAAIKNAEFSETGAFYMDGSGTAVFKSRAQVMASLAATPTAFNQTGGIPHKNVKYAFDDKLIINSSTFGRVGGTPVTVTNTDSVNKYFPHSISQTDLVAETDAIVENIAREYCATRQETTIRIDELEVDLLDPAVPTDTMIGLDYFSNLLITNVQPDGSTIVKNLQYQGISWDITPNKMTAKITTLEPIADGFIIGSSYFGIIGTNTLGY